MINLCVPVLNNYAGLDELIRSAEAGSVIPDNYFVIDNGGKWVYEDNPKITVIKPGENWGVSVSWNYFAIYVPEIRIILNDDVSFQKNSLRDFIKGMNPEKLCYSFNNGTMNSFSFFSLPDTVIEKVGLFDTKFSPAYYEDNDYAWRLHLEGDELFPVDCMVNHVGSQTLKNLSSQEREIHDENFRKNTTLYIRKWGGYPGNEVYRTPFNR